LSFGKGNLQIADATDLYTFFEIFIHEEYKIINRDLKAKMILDLGANSGYTSIYFTGIFKEAEIIAVEADPKSAEKIRRNVSPYAGRIIVESLAVAPQSGTVSFYRNFETSISGSTLERDQNAEKVTVKAVTLSELEEKYGSFDIVKFDIEGGEEDSIRPEMLRTPPTIWIGEYHEDLTGHSVQSFISRFEQYSSEVRQITKSRYSLTLTHK
jgi:FkbM family methyltransferase